MIGQPKESERYDCQQSIPGKRIDINHGQVVDGIAKQVAIFSNAQAIADQLWQRHANEVNSKTNK